MFYDEAKIYLKAGDGGNGVVAFRREAHVPRGGPSGGNGGKGGDIYLVAENQINTLLVFSKMVHFRAQVGAAGRGKNQTGAQGEDLLISVPVGTVAYDVETGQLLADLVEPGQRVLVARGGRGGRGNRAFRSAIVQAPRIAENGEPGEELWIRLELKLLADVGIIGLPNAGKSTLLSTVSAARPKIADYPFTTLEPSLGVVSVDGQDMVFADIPGLIEGAHAGAGLGHKFLRHIERTRLLVHLIDGCSRDPEGDFEVINEELRLFNPALARRPQVVALNKIDVTEVKDASQRVLAELRARGVEDPLVISAATGEGVNILLRRVASLLRGLPPPEPQEVVVAPATLLPEEDMAFTIDREASGEWRVRGKRIERIVVMTRWEYYDAVMRFQRILEALGITAALRQRGVKEGDIVLIGDKQLEWSEDNAF